MEVQNWTITVHEKDFAIAVAEGAEVNHKVPFLSL